MTTRTLRAKSIRVVQLHFFLRTVKQINHLVKIENYVCFLLSMCVGFFVLLLLCVCYYQTCIICRMKVKEMLYLTMYSTHFIYGYMASDIWLRTILIVRKETCCCHIGYSF